MIWQLDSVRVYVLIQYMSYYVHSCSYIIHPIDMLISISTRIAVYLRVIEGYGLIHRKNHLNVSRD